MNQIHLKLGTIVVLDTLLKPVDFGLRRSKVRGSVGVTTQYVCADLYLCRVHFLSRSLLLSLSDALYVLVANSDTSSI